MKKSLLVGLISLCAIPCIGNVAALKSITLNLFNDGLSYKDPISIEAGTVSVTYLPASMDKSPPANCPLFTPTLVGSLSGLPVMVTNSTGASTPVSVSVTQDMLDCLNSDTIEGMNVSVNITQVDGKTKPEGMSCTNTTNFISKTTTSAYVTLKILDPKEPTFYCTPLQF